MSRHAPAVSKRRIVDEGLRLGFSRIGFAPAELVEDEAARLAAWLERGYAGKMSYMERRPERRTDASASLSGTATVVCCALNYYLGPAEAAPPGAGVISAYARGEDYHRVLERKLDALAAFIETTTGAPTRRYVDTGPLLEKAYARASGLGWLGKHANLISRQGSSWFFLGEILVAAALPLDAPTTSHCGSCSRCITACPTGAIVAPYVVDSRLCISYLTIELRGAIPVELRKGVGNRIYGCDDCQDVCPWNKFATRSEEAAFFPREPLASMDLAAMMRMSRDAFLEATRGSAIRRARYPGFLRNVAIALGNSGDDEAVPVLIEALDHEEPLVRSHVAWALGELGGPRAQEALKARAKIEPNDEVRAEIRRALEQEQR